MAQHKLSRTPRIATGFDKGYICTNPDCESTNLDPDDDLNDRTWTCNTCGESVLVEMADDAGTKKYQVRRHPAKDLVPGDYIVQEHDLQGGILRVLGSSQAHGKGNKWFLGLQGFGSLTVEPDRYFNCIP